MRIGAQGGVGQAAEHLVIEIPVDPVHLTAGRLLDDAIRAARMVVGGLVNYAERHASRRLQQRLKLTRIAALDKEAVRIVALGQRDGARVYALLA